MPPCAGELQPSQPRWRSGSCRRRERRKARCRRRPSQTQPLVAPPAAPAQPRSPRNASYTITARLDPGSRTLKGEQLVTWRNVSTVTVNNLRFHLYYNAWRNTRSTWLRESLLSGDSLGHAPVRRLGLDRCHEPEARARQRRADRRHLAPAVRRAGRRQPRTTARSRRFRSTPPSRRARPSTPGRLDGPHSHAPSRAPASSAATTSSPSGFRRSPCSRTAAGAATSSTPPPSSSPTSASTTSA